MGIQRNEMSIILTVFPLIWAGVTAQDSDDCTNVLISMSPCLNYNTGNSSPQFSGCCTQLSTVVNKKPECLCQVLNGSESNLNINQTQALAFTSACKVQTPSASSCKGGGSSSVPSTQGGSNDATSANIPAHLSFFSLFIASYVSITNIA